MSDELVVGEVTSLESRYRWEIKNFSSIKVGVGKPICSPAFSTVVVDSSKTSTLQWRLKLYPNGFNNDSKDYLSVYLQSVDKSHNGVSSKFAVSIANDADGEVLKQCTQERRTFRSRQDWGWPRFAQRQTIVEAAKNDKLAVCCSLFATSVVSSDGERIDEEDEEDESDEEEEEDEIVEEHSSRMLSYFEKLFESGDLSDVTVVVEKKRLHLHKAILASLSPIFQATFEQESKDSPTAKEHVYEVAGLRYDTMKEMFRYIYTAKINHLEEMAGDLLAAADRYAVDRLKILCEKTLCAELTVDNALRLLELATKFRTTILKAKVTELVVSRLSEFVAKAEFKALSSACKDELLSSIAVKRPNK